MSTAISSKGPYYIRMTKKITESLSPSSLRLIDESHLHAGHRENPGTGETHFKLEVVSDSFEGMSLLQRHRKIYDILSDEMAERVHALSMKLRTPKEEHEKTSQK